MNSRRFNWSNGIRCPATRGPFVEYRIGQDQSGGGGTIFQPVGGLARTADVRSRLVAVEAAGASLIFRPTTRKCGSPFPKTLHHERHTRRQGQIHGRHALFRDSDNVRRESPRACHVFAIEITDKRAMRRTTDA